jgi:hypothetical protein
VDHRHQDQAPGVDKKMALSPLYLLASIKATFDESQFAANGCGIQPFSYREL